MKNNIIINGYDTKSVKKINHVIKNVNNNNDNNVIQAQEISELQGTLIELNNDKYNYDSKSSGIDLRSRLANSEISSILCIDILNSLNFLPPEVIPLTLNKKRLNVSLGGMGRREIVEIAQGKREQENAMSFGSRLKNLFTGGENH